MIFCTSCGEQVPVTGLVSTTVCPCGSRCFKWDDEGMAAYESSRSEVRWMGSMGGKGGPLLVTRQGFRVSLPRVA